jgi:hypothetical protein
MNCAFVVVADRSQTFSAGRCYDLGLLAGVGNCVWLRRSEANLGASRSL